MSDAIYRYVGAPDFHNGIPARDLTQDDLDALDDQQREIVAASSVYAPSRKKAAVEKKAAAGDEQKH